jgi:hypothetical protein
MSESHSQPTSNSSEKALSLFEVKSKFLRFAMTKLLSNRKMHPAARRQPLA